MLTVPRHPGKLQCFKISRQLVRGATANSAGKNSQFCLSAHFLTKVGQVPAHRPEPKAEALTSLAQPLSSLKDVCHWLPRLHALRDELKDTTSGRRSAACLGSESERKAVTESCPVIPGLHRFNGEAGRTATQHITNSDQLWLPGPLQFHPVATTSSARARTSCIQDKSH